MSQFIGRGENRVKAVLQRIFTPIYSVHEQFPIIQLIRTEDFDQLDQRYNKHKFDFVVTTGNRDVAIEVNYKHGETAARKWGNIFSPLLQKAGVLCVAINDFECLSLFDKKERRLCWQDFEDVINAFKISKVRLEDLV